MVPTSVGGAIARLRAAAAARIRAVLAFREKLHANWWQLARRAWSVRLALVAAVLSGAEVACAVFTDNPPIERGTFAVLAALVSVAAAIARLFAQSNVSSGSAE